MMFRTVDLEVRRQCSLFPLLFFLLLSPWLTLTRSDNEARLGKQGSRRTRCGENLGNFLIHKTVLKNLTRVSYSLWLSLGQFPTRMMTRTRTTMMAV